MIVNRNTATIDSRMMSPCNYYNLPNVEPPAKTINRVRVYSNLNMAVCLKLQILLKDDYRVNRHLPEDVQKSVAAWAVVSHIVSEQKRQILEILHPPSGLFDIFAI